MICYFDTSAFVPLLIGEQSSKTCLELWNEADEVVTARLLYVEAAAAFAFAHRMDRLSDDEHRLTLRQLDRLWAEFDIIEVDEPVMRRAAQLADQCALRGYDAVHCASAEQVDDDQLVVVSGDRKLLNACQELGLSTADVNPLS